jgi:hypothetical protein
VLLEVKKEIRIELKQFEYSLMWLDWKKAIFVFAYLKVVIITKEIVAL